MFVSFPVFSVSPPSFPSCGLTLLAILADSLLMTVNRWKCNSQALTKQPTKRDYNHIFSPCGLFSPPGNCRCSWQLPACTFPPCWAPPHLVEYQITRRRHRRSGQPWNWDSCSHNLQNHELLWARWWKTKTFYWMSSEKHWNCIFITKEMHICAIWQNIIPIVVTTVAANTAELVNFQNPSVVWLPFKLRPSFDASTTTWEYIKIASCTCRCIFVFFTEWWKSCWVHWLAKHRIPRRTVDQQRWCHRGHEVLSVVNSETFAYVVKLYALFPHSKQTHYQRSGQSLADVMP